MLRAADTIKGLILLLALSVSQPAVASLASELFEDGNRLFREDLYWAALLRYEEARAAGMDTPILHYNTGVAHYKARQYERARNELRQAARSPRLAALSHYNLGLTAYKAGNSKEAIRWLRLARDQEGNRKIASLAKKAIKRIRDAEQPEEAEDDVAIRSIERRFEKERPFADLDVRASIGFGNNDNVYRSPSEAYIDFARADEPLVTPEVVSGAFMPVDVGLRYNINSFKFEGFYGAYRLKGQYYQDQELDNANEFIHEFSFGNSYKREKNGITREVYSAFRIAQHEETYFDPDSGDVRIVDDVDIGERMNYRRYGPEFKFRQSGERLSFGMAFEAQLRNYEDVEVVPEYDHNYLRLLLHTQYKFAPTSIARLQVKGQTRRYGDRPSYDLDGRQRQGNPSVEYDYYSVSLGARQRVTSDLWFGVDFELTERIDGYVGYYDYTRTSFEFELSWSPGRFDLDAYGRYNLYDYPNAFAFNNNTLNRRTFESLSAGVRASWRMTRGLSIVADGRHRSTASNDIRTQYDQNQFMLSVLWRR
ncbi:MAG: hypothetical protein QNJ05_07715 [Woeseiaceae bacterium]|nr:hypothetical protein [Woeseiaceae bacterium]